MEAIVAILVIAAIVVAVVVIVRAVRSRNRAEPAPPPPQDPFDPGQSTFGDPRTLRAGDMVEYLGERLFVRGSLRLREGGYQWSEHFLDDVSGTRRWLSVEEDPDLEVVMWTELKGSDLQPSAKVLTHEGIEYRRDEHGTAQFTSEGTTGLGTSGRVEYVDFEGRDGHYLSFERFDGGEWEIGLGERIPSGTLTVYPGSDR
ncbi:DUF4178 domain-containing protein [Actinobacteria bacterium YIM 96077]|uniref:DUF4178 domain-containing protein n=1 Tax=Phytoactinopolyspora halophila TaxID=1981511 RepID=A0A329QFM3_9ACTN|nr:DUF4178 domain-containing protein [Actinobacteria bacterium YIM 96077]RAW11100.1 DUF4178 domain-containing protein [Phytoactinopolyspora halophila]